MCGEAALCSMQAARQYGGRLANGSGPRRAAEGCRAANLGAGRLGSPGHAGWLPALGIGRRLKMAASRSGQAGRVAALRTGRQAADDQPVTVG